MNKFEGRMQFLIQYLSFSSSIKLRVREGERKRKRESGREKKEEEREKILKNEVFALLSSLILFLLSSSFLFCFHFHLFLEDRRQREKGGEREGLNKFAVLIEEREGEERKMKEN